MTQNETQVPQYAPNQIDVRIRSIRSSGSVLANASVTLNGCFAIRGVKVINGSNGPFVSMPSYSTKDGYRDVCFPCTKGFKQQFDEAVLNAYQQQLSQLNQPQNAPEEPAPGWGAMSM